MGTETNTHRKANAYSGPNNTGLLLLFILPRSESRPAYPFPVEFHNLQFWVFKFSMEHTSSYVLSFLTRGWAN